MSSGGTNSISLFVIQKERHRQQKFPFILNIFYCYHLAMDPLTNPISIKFSHGTRERLRAICAALGYSENRLVNLFVDAILDMVWLGETGSTPQIVKLLRYGMEDKIQSDNQPLVETDGDGRTTYANAAFTTMCGYTLEQLKGKKPGDLLQGPKTERTIVRQFSRAIRELRPFQCAITNYHANGSIYRASVRMHPVFDEEGQLAKFRAFVKKL